MGELHQRKVLFDGQTEMKQIDQLVRLLGAPTEQTLPGLGQSQFSRFLKLKTQPKNRLDEQLPTLKPDQLRLLISLLSYEPASRRDAYELSADYLTRNPIRKSITELIRKV